MKGSIRSHAIMLLVVMVMLGGIMGFSHLYAVKYERYSASDNWTVTLNGQVYENVALEDFHFANATIGDVVVLSTTLDTVVDVVHPTLFLFTDHAAVEIFLEGRRLYTYGTTDYRLGNIVGCGNQWIDLPEDYNGQNLTIRLYVSEKKAFSSIQKIYIESQETAARSFVYEYRYPLFANAFLFVFGVILAVCVTAIMRLDKDWFRMICLSGFAICVSIWSLANTNLLILFVDDLTARVNIEYVALYLEPFFFILYFYKDCMRLGEKWPKYIYFVLTAVQAIFVVTAFLGQSLHLLRYPTVLRIQHIILVAMFLYLSAYIVTCLRKRVQIHRILVVGLAAIFASGTFDLVSYNIKRFVPEITQVRFRGIFSIGTMIFVLCLVLNYIFEMIEGIRVKSKAEMLEQMAYTDALTGLDNRRKLDETLDEIDRMGEAYTVISFDLNWLKRVNDTMGHEVGDEYLRSFANALKEVFRGVGSVYRVGGDEFAAVIRGESRAEHLVTMLKAKIHAINEVHRDWNMSVAAGAVSSVNDAGLSIHEAYRLADERMYINKKEMKALREDS